MSETEQEIKKTVHQYFLAGVIRYPWMGECLDMVDARCFEELGLRDVFNWVQLYSIERMGKATGFKAWLHAKVPNESDQGTAYLLAQAIASWPIDELEARSSYRKVKVYAAQASVRRAAESLAKKVVEQDPQTALENFQREMDLLDCADDRAKKTVQANLSHESDYFKRLARKQEHFLKHGEPLMDEMWSTGHLLTDAVLGGLQPGRLVVFGARPGGLKTTVMLMLANTLTKAGHDVEFVSLEMSDEEITHRFVAQTYGLVVSDLGEGTVPAHLWDAFVEKTAKVRSVPTDQWEALKEKAITGELDRRGEFAVYDETRQTVSSIRRRVMANRNANLKVVFIDYLTILEPEPSDAHQMRHVQVGTQTRRLKQLAKEAKICIVVGAQLNRESEGQDRGPQCRHLKDSGSIEQDADQVILLDRDEKKQLLKFLVRKNRHGPTTEISFGFDLARATIFEVAVEGQEPAHREFLKSVLKNKPHMVREHAKHRS